jgi:hypothetical protein
MHPQASLDHVAANADFFIRQRQPKNKAAYQAALFYYAF